MSGCISPLPFTPSRRRKGQLKLYIQFIVCLIEGTGFKLYTNTLNSKYYIYLARHIENGQTLFGTIIHQQITRDLFPPRFIKTLLPYEALRLTQFIFQAHLIHTTLRKLDLLLSSGKVISLHLSTAFFWAITQRIVVIPYRHFGSTYRSPILGFLTLENGKDRLSRNVGKELPLFAV